MIIVTAANISPDALDRIVEYVEHAGLRAHVSRGDERTIVGCIGEEAKLHEMALAALPGVERVMPVTKPYKRASREYSVGDTAIRFGDPANTVIGGREVVVIAGPCSVEGREMLHETVHAVQAAGARMLRGGAFKPRSSPYALQGMGEPGLQLLADVRAETGMPIVTEVMDPRQVELMAAYADVLQIGARNMQNFPLLTEVGKVQRPVLLKRGLSGTSHAGGRTDLVAPLALAAIAAGADGLIIEVHPNPAQARSDGEQSLKPSAFAAMMHQPKAVANAGANAVGRDVCVDARIAARSAA